MKEKAMQGKPYAGNPHMRFDEREVAPAATPRSGALLCNKHLLRWALGLMVVFAMNNAHAYETTYGTISSDYSGQATLRSSQAERVQTHIYNVSVPSGKRAKVTVTRLVNAVSVSKDGDGVAMCTAENRVRSSNDGGVWTYFRGSTTTYSCVFAASQSLHTLYLELETWPTTHLVNKSYYDIYGNYIPNMYPAEWTAWSWSDPYTLTVTYEDLLPDLTISSIAASHSEAAVGDSVLISYEIKNNGSEDAPATTAEIYDGVDCIASVAIPALSAGASHTGTYTVSNLSAGSHTFLLWLDPDEVITELNDNNNIGTVGLSVYDPVPYTVRFNANGGTGTMSDQAFVNGVSQNLHVNAFKNGELDFIGWSLSQTGDVVYGDHESIKWMDVGVGKKVTLFAQWAHAWTITDGVLEYADTDTYLKTVAVPYGVTRVGPNAFKDNCMVEKVILSDSVTSIGNEAFYGCRGLRNVTIPDSVTSIGDRAFYGCGGLTSVTIPDSVTYVGASAFSGCNSAFYDTMTISGVKMVDGWVVESVSGLSGTLNLSGARGIASYAFYNCTNLTSVTVPNSVTSIADHAFYNCSGLTSVTIPNSVTSIADHAFYNCSGLMSVSIPAGVMSIRSYAFYGCRALTSVTIPDSVTSIESSAFSGCSGLKSVTIPNGVTSIGSSAFSGCSSLRSVTIPDSVTSIGALAFRNCNAALFDTTTIPGVEMVDGWIVEDENGLSGTLNLTGARGIAERAFESNSGLTSVTIPDGITKICSSTFMRCSGLTSVRIPNSVTSIESFSFYGCSSLTSMAVPIGVTNIGEAAFSGCSGLKTITVVSANPSYKTSNGLLLTKDGTVLVAVPGGLTSVTIPNSVTNIADYALYNCSGLMSVTIPGSVTSIGNYAFSGCSGLTSVTIPNSVTSIGNYAFSGCSGLTSVTIPNSVTSIESYAFSGCSGLKSVTIPDSVASIGSYAFQNCNGLTSVTIPDSVTNIGRYTFSDCSGLTSVTISDSVTSIGYRAFYNCSGLTSLKIGNGVTTIEDHAFYGCSGLTSVTIPNAVAFIGTRAFYRCSLITTIYVYEGNTTAIKKLLSESGLDVTGIAFVELAAPSYTVTYKPGSYGTGSQQTATKTQGVALTLRGATFTRTGYTQTGWATSDGGSKAYSLGASYTANASVTLYPFWTANSYTVTLDRQSGSGGTASVTATYGSAMPSITVPTRSGYTFGGYYTSTGGSGTQYYTASGASARTWDKTSVTTLYAKWTAATVAYIVVYWPGAYGTGSQQTVTETYGVALTLKDAIFTRTGYTQTGWATSDGGAKAYNLGASYTANASVALYPFWTANTYTVTLDRQSGSGGSSSVTVTYGSAMPSITVPTRSGYTFGGYYTSMGGSGTQYYTASGASARAWDKTSTTTLYAKWTAVPVTTYTVTYKSGANGTGSQQTATKTQGVALTLRGATFTRTGYTQTGWATSDGGSKAYSLGASYTANAAVTLYPFWTASSYTVTLDRQSGSGGTASVTATYGSAMPSITVPTRPGYTFGGYYTSAGGGGIQYYTASGVSARTWNIAGATTLYAKWTVYCVVNFDNNYDTTWDSHTIAISVAPSIVPIGFAIGTLPTLPDHDGWIFSGWWTAAIGGTQISVSTIVTADVTYYAHWASAATFTVDNGVLTGVTLNGATAIVIPSCVTSIGDSAFSGCSGLTSMTIPDSVTNIENYAFSGCSGLTSVAIPDSVTSIGSGAFSGCSGLTSVAIPDSVTSIGGSAFSGCSGLTSVIIGNGVTSIGGSAFSGCRGLTSVAIPDGVTSIGYRTFYGCSGLTSVAIPDSVTSIRDYAFSGCSDSLFDTTTIPGVELVDGWAVGYTRSLSGSLDLTGVRGIGEGAFSGCRGLTSVTIPDSVTSIGWRAFSGCSGLTSVAIPDSVTSIGGSAFYGCSGLTSVTLPKGLEGNLPGGVFAGCPTELKIKYTGCRVVLNTNGGLFAGTSQKVVTVAKGKVVGSLPTPTREGYAFKGWFTKKSGGTKITTKTKVTKDVTYYAHWTAKKYAVTLLKGGEGTVSGAGKKAYQSKVTVKAKPSKGYVFQGWYRDWALVSQKASYSFKVPLNGVTYKAKFITTAEDKAAIGMEFGGVGFGSLEGEDGLAGRETLPVVTNACGVVTLWPIATTGATPVSVSVKGQPKGMKYDAKKKAVTGVPSVANKSGTMKITVKSAGASRTWSVKWRTVALPAFACGAFNGWTYESVEGGEGGGQGLPALPVRKVTISVTGAGKITAKVGTLALARTGWTVGEDGLYRATLSKTRTVGTGKKAKKYKDVLTLVLDPEKGWTEDQLAGSVTTYLTTDLNTPINADTAVSARRNPFGDKNNAEAKEVAAQLAVLGTQPYVDEAGLAWKLKVSASGVATISRTTGTGKKKKTTSATAVIEVDVSDPDAGYTARARFLVDGKVIEANW